VVIVAADDIDLATKVGRGVTLMLKSRRYRSSWPKHLWIELTGKQMQAQRRVRLLSLISQHKSWLNAQKQVYLWGDAW
jgi:hypothetical protein